MFGKQKSTLSKKTESPFTQSQASNGVSSSLEDSSMQLHTMQDDLRGKSRQNVSVFPTGEKAAYERVFAKEDAEEGKNIGKTPFFEQAKERRDEEEVQTLKQEDVHAKSQSPFFTRKQSQEDKDVKKKHGLDEDRVAPMTNAPPRNPPIQESDKQDAPKGMSKKRSIYEDGPFVFKSGMKSTEKKESVQVSSNPTSVSDNAGETSSTKKDASRGVPASQRRLGDIIGTKKSTISITKKTSRFTRIFFNILFVVIILSILGGAYYYWLTRMRGTLEEQSILPDINMVDISPNVDEQESFPYDFERPNPIVLGDGDMSSDPIQALDSVENTWMQYDDKTGILEFFFVDGLGGFDALSAQELSSRMGIRIDGDRFMELLGEDGRVFLYRDQNGIRIVLALVMQDRDKARALMRQEETKIVNELKPILADETRNFPVQSTFNDSAYRDYSIRYINANLQATISIDYTFRRNTLLLGTSKDSLRAVLDKLDGIGVGAMMETDSTEGSIMEGETMMMEGGDDAGDTTEN